MVEDDVVVEDEVVVDDNVVVEGEGMTVDEGYQSTLDCTMCKKNLVKLEESYKQQIAALELALKNQQNLINKYFYIKNELTNDEENFFGGKGKGGKGYVKKACDLQRIALKEEYLAKIKCEKRRFRFLQLDEKAQLMVYKIEALWGSGSDDSFIDEVLEMFEEGSMKLQSQKKVVEEMKEQQGEHVNAIDELTDQHHKSIEEKDQKIDYFKNNVQVVFVGKDN